MAVFEELWENGPLFAQAEHFKLSTDSILLADFVRIAGHRKILDLGCSSGILPLLLLVKNNSVNATGIEILPEAAALAQENMKHNRLENRSDIICQDLRNYRMLFSTGQFDLITANPPYYPAGSGFISQKEDRATARTELSCTLEDLCSAAEYLLKTGGDFCLVHKPERLSEIFCCMTRHSIEPKRLRTIAATSSKAPSLVLIEGRRGGKPGLKMEAPLILKEPDGKDSAEICRIYHRTY